MKIDLEMGEATDWAEQQKAPAMLGGPGLEDMMVDSS